MSRDPSSSEPGPSSYVPSDLSRSVTSYPTNSISSDPSSSLPDPSSSVPSDLSTYMPSDPSSFVHSDPSSSVPYDPFVLCLVTPKSLTPLTHPVL